MDSRPGPPHGKLMGRLPGKWDCSIRVQSFCLRSTHRGPGTGLRALAHNLIELSHLQTPNPDETIFKIKSESICLSVGVSRPFALNVLMVGGRFMSIILLFIICLSPSLLHASFTAFCWANRVFINIPLCPLGLLFSYPFLYLWLL